MIEQLFLWLKDNYQIAILISAAFPTIVGALFYFRSLTRKKTYECILCKNRITTEADEVFFCSACRSVGTYDRVD